MLQLLLLLLLLRQRRRQGCLPRLLLLLYRLERLQVLLAKRRNTVLHQLLRHLQGGLAACSCLT
jgi:hypothetical protein